MIRTRLSTVLGFLILAGLACNLPADVDSIDTPISPTDSTVDVTASPIPDSPCGDGICQGPENSDLCPADCPAPEETTSPDQNATTAPDASFADLPAPGPCDAVVCRYASVTLLDMMDRSLEHNVLKLFSTAIDAVRNRIYVSGIMTTHIGVLDGASEAWIDTVYSGIIGNSLKYLYVDPVANYLYIVDTTNAELRRIALDSGERVGPVSLPFGIGGHNVAIDTTRTRFYLTTGDSPSFRAFDGHTLDVIYTNDEMGLGTGNMAYDEQDDLLYILDSAAEDAQRAIHVLDPNTGGLQGAIRYNAPPGVRARWLAHDPEQRQFVVGSDRFVFFLDEDGNEVGAFPIRDAGQVQDVLYDPISNQVVVLSLDRPAEGQVSGVGGIYQVYDPDSGQLTSEVTFGRKPHRMELNPANQHIYIANGDASAVWSIDTHTFDDALPLHLGDSLEQIVVSGDGRTLVLSSRLGGSYMATLDLDTGAFDSFESGTWPLPLRRDADGQQLFVLNAWDSTLSVHEFDAQHTSIGLAELGPPAGSTDRLPDLAIDGTRQRAYAAYPEFGQIAVVDLETLQTLSPITLTGFETGDIGGSPGQLQVAVNVAAGRLFAFWARAQLLSVFNVTAAPLEIDELDLSGLGWSRSINVGADFLFFDAGTGRLFVGPFELDGVTGAPTGRSLAGGTVIFGLNEADNLYWAYEVRDRKVTLFALDRDSLSVVDSTSLDTTATLTPTFGYNAVRDEIYVGYLNTATLELYTTGTLR